MSSIIDLIVSSSPVEAHPSCPVEAHPSCPVEAFAKGSGAVFPSKAPSDHVREQMDSAAESVHTVVYESSSVAESATTKYGAYRGSNRTIEARIYDAKKVKELDAVDAYIKKNIDKLETKLAEVKTMIAIWTSRQTLVVYRRGNMQETSTKRARNTKTEVAPAESEEEPAEPSDSDDINGWIKKMTVTQLKKEHDELTRRLQEQTDPVIKMSIKSILAHVTRQLYVKDIKFKLSNMPMDELQEYARTMSGRVKEAHDYQRAKHIIARLENAKNLAEEILRDRQQAKSDCESDTESEDGECSGNEVF